jgi:hypothetical protein
MDDGAAGSVTSLPVAVSPSNASLQRLARLASKAPRRPADVRMLARFAANGDCRLATLGFAARVDFDRLLRGTRFEAPFGQSPFAFRRGTRFEGRLHENGYAPLLDLFRTHLGYGAADAGVVDVREGFEKSYQGMTARAQHTELLVRKIVKGAKDAPNLIDGAVLTRVVGGIRAFFEADAVAARFEEPIHVGEVKSFPTVDGHADPEKVGAAVSQVAIYILLLRDLVGKVGGLPELVSSNALLITPLNTGLRPTLTMKAVGREVDRAHRILARAPDATQIAAALPDGLPTFAAVADEAAPERARVAAVSRLADEVGTTYRPVCLSACGLSRLCRYRAASAGEPARVGASLVRLLPGVRSLDRVGELVDGATALPEERPVAEQLVQAARLRERFAPEAGTA